MPGAKRFLTGFLVTGAVMAFLNLLPYLQSRGAYKSDGYELIGFPLTFHRTGGFAYVDESYPAAFLADAALAIASALLVGLATARIGLEQPRRVQPGH